MKLDLCSALRTARYLRCWFIAFLMSSDSSRDSLPSCQRTSLSSVSWTGAACPAVKNAVLKYAKQTFYSVDCEKQPHATVVSGGEALRYRVSDRFTSKQVIGLSDGRNDMLLPPCPAVMLHRFLRLFYYILDANEATPLRNGPCTWLRA